MKGLSPLISAILLMLITVAAVGAAYLFLNAMQSRIQLRTQETIEHTLSKGELEIEYVECTNVSNYTKSVTVYVKNVGTVDISVDGSVTLLVTDTDGTAKFLAYNNTTKTLSTGKLYSFTFDNTTGVEVNETIVPGDKYSVKLTLPDGTYAVGECVYK